MWLLLKGNVRRQFKATLQVGAQERQSLWKAKKRWPSLRLKKSLQKKGKSDNGENLDSSCSFL